MFENLLSGLNLKCLGSPWRCLRLGMTLSNRHLIEESGMGWRGARLEGEERL